MATGLGRFGAAHVGAGGIPARLIFFRVLTLWHPIVSASVNASGLERFSGAFTRGNGSLLDDMAHITCSVFV